MPIDQALPYLMKVSGRTGTIKLISGGRIVAHQILPMTLSDGTKAYRVIDKEGNTTILTREQIEDVIIHRQKTQACELQVREPFVFLCNNRGTTKEKHTEYPKISNKIVSCKKLVVEVRTKKYKSLKIYGGNTMYCTFYRPVRYKKLSLEVY